MTAVADVSISPFAEAVDHALVDRLTGMIRAGADAERMRPDAPFVGEPLFSFPQSTEEDVEEAFAEAREAQVEWAARPVAERARIIGKFHHLALRRQHEAIDLVQLETGKARYDAFLDFLSAPVYARYISRTASSVLATQRRLGFVPLLTKAELAFRPKGVVGVVSAWNYPMVFAAADCLSALVAGNAVVHRPAVESALSAIWVRSIAVECGVPEAVWQVVVGRGSVIGNAVTERCDHVAFTGSTAVGRQIAARAGERLIGISLELGGKNPFIVLPEANLDKAADALIRASFVNAGQTCVGPERILVDQRVYQPFREVLRSKVEALRVGAALSYDYDMGSLLDAKQLATVTRHVEDAVANGASVLVGGQPRPDIGPCFFEPTILEDVRPGMLACTEETFGPVVSLYPYSTEDELVELANATDYGLHAVIWGDARAARRLAGRIQAGTVEINESITATWGSADLPQGGVKASGFGRRNGPEGILRYTEPQSISTQRLLTLSPPGSMSNELFAALAAHSLRALHLTGRR